MRKERDVQYSRRGFKMGGHVFAHASLARFPGCQRRPVNEEGEGKNLPRRRVNDSTPSLIHPFFILTLKVIEGAPSFPRAGAGIGARQAVLIQINSNYPRLPDTGGDASMASLRRDSLKLKRVAWPIVSNDFCLFMVKSQREP
jgi:hypothetical protein